MNAKMVYRGTDRVHISDGFRGDVGEAVSSFVDGTMRSDAVQDGLLTYEQSQSKQLCPGCYMTVIFNAARDLAMHNGQSLSELGRTMAAQFAKLEHGDTGPIEEVTVLTDDPDVIADDAPGVEPYLNDFGPNQVETDAAYVVGLSSYGLDFGDVR